MNAPQVDAVLPAKPLTKRSPEVTELPPISARDDVANALQVLLGATPSALNEYRLLTKRDHERVLFLLRSAIDRIERHS